MDKKFLTEICEIDGISSDEIDVRKKLKEKFNNYDNLIHDGIGSQIFEYCGDGPKLMFASHMDEVGFMVKNIKENGLIDVIAIGGIKDTARNFQKVRITNKKRETFIGLLNSFGDEVYVDIGVNTKEEVERLCIDIGDMVCFASESEWLNKNVLMAKALDDRIGNFVLSEVDRRLKNIKRENSIYLCNTVQEEVGTRGGKCSADIVKPDIFFAIDVATAQDLDRSSSNNRKIGNGFMILNYDKTMLPNKKLLNYLKELANKKGLAFQNDMFKGGGTDAGEAHLIDGGRLAVVLGIPLRYCHGNYSIVDMRDVNSLIEFILEIIKDFNTDMLNEVKNWY